MKENKEQKILWNLNTKSINVFYSILVVQPKSALTYLSVSEF